MKYYFITYQASNRSGSISVWNQVIDIRPMEFIIMTGEIEGKEGNGYYNNFVIINTLEITKEEYLYYKDRF